MPIPKLTNVVSKYGAPMGRQTFETDNDAQLFYLQKLKMVGYGDYDSGGAYWGYGLPIYRYVSEDGEAEGFVRANNREHAKRQVRGIYPRARFFN